MFLRPLSPPMQGLTSRTAALNRHGKSHSTTALASFLLLAFLSTTSVHIVYSSNISPRTSSPAPVRAAKYSAINCCAMSEDELKAMNGTNAECPGKRYTDTHSQISAKCQKCAPGLCRIGKYCYCPSKFLTRSEIQGLCTDSFGASWPDSIKREDVSYRSCLQNPPTAESSAISCCALPASVLQSMRGLSDDCPSSWSVMSSIKPCTRCPPGTCRAMSRYGTTKCICAGYFLASEELHMRCEQDYGTVYPESVTKAENLTAWKNCSNRKVPKVTFPDGSTTAPQTTAAGSGAGDTDTETGTPDTPPARPGSTTTTGKPSPSPSRGDDVDGNNVDEASALDETPENRTDYSLTTLEIVGIVAGVISAVVTVIGAVKVKRRSMQRKEREEELGDYSEIF